MFYTKFCLLVTIFGTWGAAWKDHSLPYFPIEISRTATGRISKRIFQIGVSLTTFVMYYESDSWTTYIAWGGLLLLAFLDDRTNFEGHLIGVFIMGFGVALHAMLNPWAHMVTFGIASIIYGIRVLIKTSLVILLEMEMPVTKDTVVNIAFNVNSVRTDAIERIKDIMYNGEDKCKYPSITIPLFALCGCLQWLAFYIFSTIY